MATDDSSPHALRPVHDLAGTPARDAGGLPIGAIYGALAEAASGLLRYFDLALDGGRRHVLVPVGHARLLEEPEGHVLRLRAAVRRDLDEIPTFDAAHPGVDAAFEDGLLTAYGRCFHGERYYAHPAYDHGGLYAGPHPIVSGAAPGLRRVSRAGPPAAGAPIGRALLGLAGDPIARVTDVIVDEGNGARYVEVETRDGHRTLLPVGYVRAAADGPLHAPGLLADDLAALPPAPDAPDRETERALLDALQARFRGERRYLRPDFLFEC